MRPPRLPFIVNSLAEQKSSKPVGKEVPVEEVVQRAVVELRLPKPVPRVSPDEGFAQVVHVPTWLWVERSGWGPVSKSAAVEGVEVTATARPKKAVWDMGDGGVVVCRGPGTPYSSRFGGKSSSPDCGHTYRRSSSESPEGKFRVRVTVFWDVSWSGAGRSGVVPGITRSSEMRLSVEEVQAVATN